MGQAGLAPHQKKARRLNAWILFIDESGILSSPLVRRTWAPRGCTPILHQKGRRYHRVSAIAALAINPTHSSLRLFSRLHQNIAIDGTLVRDFLRQILLQVKGPVVIVWDRLNTHRSKKVQLFRARHPRLRLELLPPYAPELNPVEYAWAYLKNNPLANRPSFSIEELSRMTYSSTRRLQGQQNLLRSFLAHCNLSLRIE